MAIFDWFKKPSGNRDESYNEELADMVEKEYIRRQTERRPFETQWRLNGEFINGNQHLDINPVTQTIEEIPKQYWYQEREVFNQIATIFETRVSRLSRQRPLMKTRPASGDDRDVSTAKISSMLLASSWHSQDMNRHYARIAPWMETTGTVFLKPTWNKNKGRIVYRGMEPDPGEFKKEEGDVNPELFGAEFQQVEIREGDIDTVVVNSFEFYPESSYAEDMEYNRSVIHAKARHIFDIEDEWGIRVEPEKVDVMTMQKTTTSTGGLGYISGGYRTTIRSLENHAVVKEYYEKPSKKYPQGRYIVVAGGKTLHAGPMPYMIGEDGQPEFPFIRIVDIDVAGQFWGDCVVRRCIPVQRRYNALRNRKAEYLNLVAIGQWYEPNGSIDEETELNNEPGNIIRHNPGMQRPEPVTWPSLPSSFENEEQTLLAEFTAISGVSELSRFSEAPSGVKSGVALSIANEQDDTRIATTATNIANGIVLLGRYWIRLYRQFAKEPRILRSVGASRDVDVKEWVASDLTSDDVFIENVAALSETPSQRRQMVFDLIGTGIFNRPETNPFDEDSRQKIFQLIEFGHWESGVHESDTMMHKSRAKRENRYIIGGQMVQAMDFDDHALHIQQHNRMRMSAEYEQMLKTEMGPLIDQIMRLHIAEHMQMMIELLQPQGQMLPPQDQTPQGSNQPAVI